MPKKKRAPRPRVWGYQDKIELLAYLDFTLEHKLDFRSTVIRHLASVTGKQFNDRQVFDKLHREWEYCGRHGGKFGSDQDLLSEGSSFLVEWTDGDHEEVKEALQRLQPPASRYRFRSTPLATTATSRTLSRSVTRQTSDTSSLSELATPEFEDLEYAQGDEEKRTEVAYKVDLPSSPTSSALSGSVTTEDKDENLTLSVGVKTEAGPPSQVLSVGSVRYVDAASQATPPPDARTKIAERERVDKHVELDTARGKILQQQNYIFTLKNRLSVSEQERQKIRHSARAAAHHGDDLVMQRDIRFENFTLRNEIETVRRQRLSVELVETNSLGPSDKFIEDKFEQIMDDVRNACSSVDAGIPNPYAIAPKWEEGGGALASWARRLTRCSVGQFVSSALDNGTRDDDIVRSIGAVGLYTLVFESRFPDFTARESPLLDQYRKHILTKVGPKLLSQLDLLACESLMSEEYFLGQVVMEQAKILAGELANTLACFIPPTDETHLNVEDDARGQDATNNTAAEYFIAGLVCALELKARLVLSRKKYKLVFFVSGAQFDPEAMVRNTDMPSDRLPRRKRNRKGLPKPQEADDRAPIRLCLFPALYVKEEKERDKEEGIGVGITDCLVDYANIVIGDADELDGSYKTVIKAVVSV